MTHRLTRPVNYNQDDPAKPARTMNVANLDFRTTKLDRAWRYRLLIGLGYVAVMPPASRRTERSDAEEIGILFCLMTVASPLARQYYFVWLFFPMTVLIHRAAYDPRPAGQGRDMGRCSAIAGGLLCLSLPVFPNDLQAVWQQSRCHHRARGGAGLAHVASADRECRLASGHGPGYN